MKKKIAPAPGSDSTQIRPPYRSAIILDMASPMPVHGVFVVGVKPLEDRENTVLVLGIDSYSIVTHGEDPLAAFGSGTNVDLTRSARIAELDGIADEILEELGQFLGIGLDRGRFLLRPPSRRTPR